MASLIGDLKFMQSSLFIGLPSKASPCHAAGPETSSEIARGSHCCFSGSFDDSFCGALFVERVRCDSRKSRLSFSQNAAASCQAVSSFTACYMPLPAPALGGHRLIRLHALPG